MLTSAEKPAGLGIWVLISDLGDKVRWVFALGAESISWLLSHDLVDDGQAESQRNWRVRGSGWAKPSPFGRAKQLFYAPKGFPSLKNSSFTFFGGVLGDVFGWSQDRLCLQRGFGAARRQFTGNGPCF